MHSIIFHAHQKLDRVAYRHFRQLLPEARFPELRQILAFEAGHGPDGARYKRQQQGGEQPWHFVDPHDATDQQLYELIELHYGGLKRALARADDIRAAFEAAWLAHALVDGLTPAHHYPYEQELERLSGSSRNERRGLLGRLYIKGEDARSTIRRSLQLIGPRGLLTSHAMFEAGAYTVIAPLKLAEALPTRSDLEKVLSEGVLSTFKSLVKEVAEMEIYDRFRRIGWTQTISQDVRREVAPRMARMVTLAWYAAACEAGA